jgi:hypothetical protein
MGKAAQALMEVWSPERKLESFVSAIETAVDQKQGSPRR